MSPIPNSNFDHVSNHAYLTPVALYHALDVCHQKLETRTGSVCLLIFLVGVVIGLALSPPPSMDPEDSILIKRTPTSVRGDMRDEKKVMWGTLGERWNGSTTYECLTGHEGDEDSDGVEETKVIISGRKVLTKKRNLTVN